jgi:outer membrane protein assembly factor BamB
VFRIYEYEGSTFDLVSIDPRTGAYTTVPNPTGESGGTMLLGSDGDIYIGTRAHAHVLRYDPASNTLTDLGRLGNESYVWALAEDGRGAIYAGTYPSAKLFRIVESSGGISDLGRLSDQQYVRSLAVANGFVYAGIGSARALVVAYDIATGTHRELLANAETPGFAQVERYSGGVLASVEGRYFDLRGENATPMRSAPRITAGLPSSQAAALDSQYPGKPISIFRFAVGPDAQIYGSSILPAYLFRVAPSTLQIANLGYAGGGEVYSLAASGHRLVMAAYYGMAKAPIMIFDPSRPYENGRNPKLVHFAGEDPAWRPWAIVAGPDGTVYIGAQPGYGRLGGVLVALNPDTGAVSRYDDVVPGQSIESLAVAGRYLVGATNVQGGTGATASASNARIFLWDIKAHRVVFDAVPVPGAKAVTDLVTAANGVVFGVGGNSLFAFDPRSKRIVHVTALRFGAVIPNCLQEGPDGALWGLARSGIFRIDARTAAVTFVTRTGVPVTAGMALLGQDIYFASGANMYRYHIRVAVNASRRVRGWPQ